jgi:hypothetical protein
VKQAELDAGTRSDGLTSDDRAEVAVHAERENDHSRGTRLARRDWIN